MNINIEYVRERLNKLQERDEIDDWSVGWNGMIPVFEVKPYSFSESTVEFTGREIIDFISKEKSV